MKKAPYAATAEVKPLEPYALASRISYFLWGSMPDEFLFDLEVDSRERANRGRRDPERLAAMRARYAAWEATVPVIPEDAAWSIPYAPSEVARPGSV